MGHILSETARYTIRWYDDAQTILYLEILQPWTWEDAHHAIGVVNDTVRQTPHDVYTVYHFGPHVPMLPKGPAFANLRSLMSVDLPNEQMLVFIGGSMILKRFMDIVSKVYGIRQAVTKFHFVTRLEEALALVSAHKAQQAQEQTGTADSA